MATKAELEEQAKTQGIDPKGLSKAQLEEALKEQEAGSSGDSGYRGVPYNPQARRNG